MMAASQTRPLVFADDRPTTLNASDGGQLLLDALGDVDCRGILEATGEEALSASEVSEVCDLSLSTTYRKLDMLQEAGLLEEGIRLRRSGRHTSEYSRCIDDVHVSVDAGDGIELTLFRRGAADAR